MRNYLAVLLLIGAGGCVTSSSFGLGGYALSEGYPVRQDSVTKTMPDGSLRVRAQTVQPVYGADAVYLYLSPLSHRIGKIVLNRSVANLELAKSAAQVFKQQVEADYPDWERQRAPIPMGRTGGEMISRLSQEPHAFIVFYRPVEKGAEAVLELEYSARAPQRKAWRQRVKAEAAEVATNP